MKPSIGRIVTYYSYGSPGGEFKPEPRAAIVTQVYEDDECHLTIFNPTGLFMNRVKYSEEPKPGCWNWPTKV